jgi:multidrug efflux pump subunit AcrB
MVALLVGGLVAHPLLPVSALQDINYPTVTVTAQLPGADPQTMASTVASPLELQFGEIPGLTQMTSASAVGYTQITLQFDLNRNKDFFQISEALPQKNRV